MGTICFFRCLLDSRLTTKLFFYREHFPNTPGSLELRKSFNSRHCRFWKITSVGVATNPLYRVLQSFFNFYTDKNRKNVDLWLLNPTHSEKTSGKRQNIIHKIEFTAPSTFQFNYYQPLLLPFYCCFGNNLTWKQWDFRKYIQVNV